MTTTADVMVRRLIGHGVTTVFGLPGEENLAFVDALERADVELVVTRHEQHAAFMAATHGRLTGSPGVCLATLGPGATNLFTGLAHAELGGMPLIAITGQKPRVDNDEGSFQVLDIPASARPLIRWASSVDDPRNASAVVDEAWQRALESRPGAVLVELPEDVAGATVDAHRRPLPRRSSARVDAASLAQASASINAAQHVVILASEGAQLHDVPVQLTAFSERTGIGVLATQVGKGAFPENHRHSLRALGIHRPDYAHLGIAPADLVITVGYQPVEHPPLAWNPDETKSIIHIAASPAAIERGYQPIEQLVGDVASTLSALADSITARSTTQLTRTTQVIDRLLEAESQGPDFPPSPLAIVRSIRRELAPSDIVALDNGAFKIWFARHYPAAAPHTILLDNTLATMGAGLATAMEAARLAEDNRVVAVCGDGGFLMNVQDLDTATRLGLDLTVVVLRDDAYGFIAWHQDEQDRPRTGVALTNPDLGALAAAFGIAAHVVTPEAPFEAQFRAALAEPGVSLVDCPIDYGINERLSTDLHGIAERELANHPEKGSAQ
ncbi:MAG: acetolactate synthase large subunit [Acidimicrobiales bacterium]